MFLRSSGSSWSFLGLCWDLLGRSWSLLRRSWSHLEVLGDGFRASCGGLRASCGGLRAVLGGLGADLGGLGADLGGLRGGLGRSWGGLGRSWGGLGRSWGGLGRAWVVWGFVAIVFVGLSLETARLLPELGAIGTLKEILSNWLMAMLISALLLIGVRSGVQAYDSMIAGGREGLETWEASVSRKACWTKGPTRASLVTVGLRCLLQEVSLSWSEELSRACARVRDRSWLDRLLRCQSPRASRRERG